MFNFTPDKLPEKYASTICCEVCVDEPNKSVHVRNPVSLEVVYFAVACQFGFPKRLNCFCKAFGVIATRSTYGAFCSSTTQHLKLT